MSIQDSLSEAMRNLHNAIHELHKFVAMGAHPQGSFNVRESLANAMVAIEHFESNFIHSKDEEEYTEDNEKDLSKVVPENVMQEGNVSEQAYSLLTEPKEEDKIDNPPAVSFGDNSKKEEHTEVSPKE